MFDLTFTGELNDEGIALGTITVGDFRETFGSHLDVWSERDYRASWRRAAALLSETGACRFLVSASVPGSTFVAWPCWRRGDSVLVTNTLIFPHETHTYAGPSDAERFSGSTYLAAEESRWICTADDIVAFEPRLQSLVH